MTKQCYQCEKRTVGCHSTCESYIQYRKELDEYNKKLHREMAIIKGLNPRWSKVRGKWVIRR